jgi:hypothetical protein
MSAGLRDLLFTMRQHPCFPELLKMVTVPEVKQYRPNKGEGPEAQYAEWIFRSGQQRQQENWLNALTEFNPPIGGVSETSQTEKS